jgi:hypothetical protein
MLPKSAGLIRKRKQTPEAVDSELALGSKWNEWQDAFASHGGGNRFSQTNDSSSKGAPRHGHHSGLFDDDNERKQQLLSVSSSCRSLVTGCHLLWMTC